MLPIPIAGEYLRLGGCLEPQLYIRSLIGYLVETVIGEFVGTILEIKAGRKGTAHPTLYVDAPALVGISPTHRVYLYSYRPHCIALSSLVFS